MIDERDRRILALAVPALFTLAVEPLYLLVDTAIVGRLGAVPLAGLALASTVLTSLLWAFNFLAFGVTTRVAWETGAGDRRAASGVAVQALWIAIVIGVALSTVVALWARPLASVLGGEGASLDAAVTYLQISAVSMPAALVMLTSHGVFRGWSDTRTPLAVVVASNILNVILEVVFVYGFDWGVAGSAWGTVIAQWLAAAWFLGLIGRAVRATDAQLRPIVAEAWQLVSIGRHIVVRTAALLGALALGTAAAGRVGTAALGGHQIAQQTFVFLALIVDALAVAAQAIIGTASGAGDRVEADQDTKRLLRLGAIVGGALTVIVIALAPVLPRVFSNDDAVISAATTALVALGIMQVPGAITFVLDGVLMGRSEFSYVKWVTLAALAAYVPIAAAVFVNPDLGLGTVWGGLVAWMVVRAALNWRRYRSPSPSPSSARAGMASVVPNLSKGGRMPRELNILGTAAIVRVSSADTGGAYTVMEQSGGTGDLTPPHANANEDIALAVIEGEVEVETSSGSQNGGIGSTFSLPRGTHHTIRASGDGTTRLLYVFTPGGCEAFFEEVDSFGAAATPEKVGEIAAKYGITIGPAS